ncbi:MAG TPA: ABC transporter permease [Candidatus Acidoferrum sp.]|nr:ABC transporter permease [Candidatus Methylomirabilis sp.]HWU37212.1 ABC transporter permease [Candidatus Acidoferrum sp.]
MIRTAAAFIKRDCLQDISYRTGFVLKLMGVLFTSAILYFLTNVFGGTASIFLKPYGGKFFPFVLIGVALLDYHTLSLQIFSNSIRESQLMGTLEIMLLSPTRLSAIVCYSSLWGYIFTSFRFILYLMTGILIFGLNLQQANLIGASLVLGLSIVCFAGLGIITASIIMLIKEASSVNLILGAVSLMIGGVAYPVDVLPHWLRQLSVLLPVAHSLNAMRQALLQGYSLVQLTPELLKLIAFAGILLPGGLLAFQLVVRRVKFTGTLGHY